MFHVHLFYGLTKNKAKTQKFNLVAVTKFFLADSQLVMAVTIILWGQSLTKAQSRFIWSVNIGLGECYFRNSPV